METHIATTPFGRRPLTLAHVQTQAVAKARPVDKVVNKWAILTKISTAKSKIGISDRGLAVLDALLSFHPETALTGDSLVVFPSNDALSTRLKNMPLSTLRRQLSALVDAGLIIRRDSPNGKRFAHRGQGGAITMAFGFDLSPMVARADEFEAYAAIIEREEIALKISREQITLCRRDIVKMIAVGVDENVSLDQTGNGPTSWPEIHTIHREIIERIPRTANLIDLQPIVDELTKLAAMVLILLEHHIKASKTGASESQDERHIQSSNKNSDFDLEPACQGSHAHEKEVQPETSKEPLKQVFSLETVLDACPDIVDYANGGIRNWRDLFATATVVFAMMGVTPSAWNDAKAVMGDVPAAIVMAAILQKGAKINSAGAYLRKLTTKCRKGEFRIGPMLMALVKQRKPAEFKQRIEPTLHNGARPS